jgi:hypothetical protein
MTELVGEVSETGELTVTKFVRESSSLDAARTRLVMWKELTCDSKSSEDMDSVHCITAVLPLDLETMILGLC